MRIIKDQPLEVLRLSRHTVNEGLFNQENVLHLRTGRIRAGAGPLLDPPAQRKGRPSPWACPAAGSSHTAPRRGVLLGGPVSISCLHPAPSCRAALQAPERRDWGLPFPHQSLLREQRPHSAQQGGEPWPRLPMAQLAWWVEVPALRGQPRGPETTAPAGALRTKRGCHLRDGSAIHPQPGTAHVGGKLSVLRDENGAPAQGTPK